MCMPRMLDSTETRLIDVANTIIANTPNTNTIASAALSCDGQIFSGVNVYHFAGTCAEMVVVGVAGAHGAAVDLSRIVSVGDADRGVVNPCGRCRQVLRDLHPGIRVIVQGGASPPVTVGVDELLPYPYSNRS